MKDHMVINYLNSMLFVLFNTETTSVKWIRNPDTQLEENKTLTQIVYGTGRPPAQPDGFTNL